MMTLTLSKKIPDVTDDVKQMEQKLGNNTIRTNTMKHKQ